MASSYTVGQVAEAGFALSRMNRPELLETQQTFLIRTVERTLGVLYQFAARVNPLVFSAQAIVPLNSGYYTRPVNAESVFRLQQSNAEVKVIPYDDIAAYEGVMAVYRLGALYYVVGNSTPPTLPLTFFFSRRPTALTDWNDRLDTDFPDAYVSILEYEIACVQAMADGGRDGELDRLVAERNRHIVLFENYLEHETANETNRFIVPRRIKTERREPLRALVQAGG